MRCWFRETQGQAFNLKWSHPWFLNGKNSNDGLTESTAVQELRYAVGKITNQTTVFVKNGTYTNFNYGTGNLNNYPAASISGLSDICKLVSGRVYTSGLSKWDSLLRFESEVLYSILLELVIEDSVSLSSSDKYLLAQFFLGFPMVKPIINNKLSISF